MALTPENFTDPLDEAVVPTEEEAVEIEPAKTWAIDFEAGTIGGFIDEENALRQYIRKAILTERSKYAIYSDDYGCELNELIGVDVTPALIETEIPRMVYEALAYDDRIDDVQTTFTREGDKLFLTVTVFPVDKDVAITEEVTVDGL